MASEISRVVYVQGEFYAAHSAQQIVEVALKHIALPDSNEKLVYEHFMHRCMSLMLRKQGKSTTPKTINFLKQFEEAWLKDRSPKNMLDTALGMLTGDKAYNEKVLKVMALFEIAKRRDPKKSAAETLRSNLFT